jgi:WD40 repeat protein
VRMLLSGLVTACVLLLTAGCSAPMFDLAKWQRSQTPPFSDKIRILAFSPSGEYLAACHEYEAQPKIHSNLPYTPRAVKIWQRADASDRYKEVAAFPIEDTPMDQDCFRFTADGRQLAILTEHGLWFWDVEKRVLRQTGITGAIALSYDAAMAAKSVNRDGMPPTDLDGGNCVAIVDTTTGKTLQILPCDGCEQTCPRCFSPNGELILIAVAEKKMHPGMLASPPILEIWNLRSGERQCRVATDGWQGRQWRFSPDGRQLVMMLKAFRENERLELFDTATGKRQAVLCEDVSDLHSPTFSPDGRTLVIGGRAAESPHHFLKPKKRGGELRAWDMRTNKEVLTFYGESPLHVNRATALAYSPNNKEFVVGDDEGNIVWISDLPCVRGESDDRDSDLGVSLDRILGFTKTLPASTVK